MLRILLMNPIEDRGDRVIYLGPEKSQLQMLGLTVGVRLERCTIWTLYQWSATIRHAMLNVMMFQDCILEWDTKILMFFEFVGSFLNFEIFQNLIH